METKFNMPEADVVFFESEDVITASSTGDENESPFIPYNE